MIKVGVKNQIDKYLRMERLFDFFPLNVTTRHIHNILKYGK
jgi:hypothetical protein